MTFLFTCIDQTNPDVEVPVTVEADNLKEAIKIFTDTYPNTLKALHIVEIQ